MINNEYLISENSLEEITRNLEKCTTDLRNLISAGKFAGKKEEDKTVCCPDCKSDYILFSNWTDENMVVSGKLDPPADFIICMSCGSQFRDPEEKEEI
jgi:DNA-directed RNA polymerase subunit RPC12/RpoP